MREIEKLVENLNHDDKAVRLESLSELFSLINAGKLERAAVTNNVNNHIHTCYSFSPYSPTMALWKAYSNGLVTAGIMDHDSVGGVREFIEAGKIAKIATTIGFECRVDCSKTRLAGRRINNPDQSGVAYVAMHGIPHTKIDEAERFLAPYRENRNKRNRKMVQRLAQMFAPYGIDLDFESDVVPLSKASEGGSITERHILFALSKKVVQCFGKGAAVVSFIKDKLNMHLSSKVEGFLMDSSNPYYEYDLLGAMKSDLVESFYIDATDECPDIRDFIDFGKRIGAITAYAYLGDVGDSVTGDKKAQKFEDDYLGLLFEVLKEVGFDAVTYMPTRNSLPQLERVRKLCAQYELFEISGEDINSPRQSFICEALKRPEFAHLIDSTWALIGHEKAATADISDGMFTQKTVSKMPSLQERIAYFGKIGKGEI